MKRFILVLLVCLLFAGCADNMNEDSMAPDVQTTVYDIPLEEAREMIEPVEDAMALLSMYENISREDAERFIDYINKNLGPGQGEQILMLYMTDAYDLQSEMAEIPLGNGTVVPTLQHFDVELVSAVIEESAWTEDGNEKYRAVLTIRKEYTGTDAVLKDWYTEYIYQKHTREGNFEFYTFSGIMNVKKENILKSRENFSG